MDNVYNINIFYITICIINLKIITSKYFYYNSIYFLTNIYNFKDKLNKIFYNT